ncbi:MAG: sulfatase-like hydrolase/transferase, partial [bacterium]
MTCHESTRESELRRRARETNEAALDWISKHQNQDFFCWIHYMDVHGPYEAPQPYCALFVGEIEGVPSKNLRKVPNGALGGIPEYQILSPTSEDGKLVGYETNYHYYFARYDGGIAYTDSAIDDLVRALCAMGIYDDLLLIITSDHGEALGENDVYFFHGMTVTMDQIHIPLIMKFPATALFNQKIIQTQVSSLDIAPTVLDFYGLPPLDFSEEKAIVESMKDQGMLHEATWGRGEISLGGISLLPIIREESRNQENGRIVFSEIETQVSAINGQTQYLIGRMKSEKREFEFLHPDAPTSESILKYRTGYKTGDSVWDHSIEEELIEAAGGYLKISEKISLEKIAKLEGACENGTVPGFKQS